jgi:oligoribonuclease NrnB/cAMP/cGMP phosphodiesterase (DHH superfamily)
MNYGVAPQAYEGRNIFVVDFSFPRPVLERLAAANRVVIVLDHHKTAAEELAGLPPPPTIGEYEFIDTAPVANRLFPNALCALFDMDRSGAGIAWDYFNPGDGRPILINRIEDRDLWRFKLPGTRQIHAALASYKLDDFAHFNEMVATADVGEGFQELYDQGAAIDRRHIQMCNETIKAGTRQIIIAGHRVPFCNAPFAFSSDIGNILQQGQPFAATYFDLGDGRRQVSLRSSDAGLDVSEIAKKYGGGGHRNAAGFNAPGGWEGEVP